MQVLILLFNVHIGPEILRTSGRFYWPNDKGEPWRDVLRREARKEFEAARHEKVRTIYVLIWCTSDM